MGGGEEQGCGLRKITRKPKVPKHEILGAWHLGLYKKVLPVTQAREVVVCVTQALLEHILSF